MKFLLSLFVVLSVALGACHQKKTLFEKISSSRSGIDFNNKIVENDSINPLDVVNIYNGGGVGIGDFNNDGLQDIYLTGNMVSSKLYLNKGSFEFEDITERAGVEGMGRWARGVSIVDINNDGLPDIYVCNTIYKDSLRRRNILYVNEGLDKGGIPHFKDSAAEYGLDIHVQSTMAYFFDYDNDGDLDMYLAVNEAANGYNTSVFGRRNETTSAGPNRGRLFRNDLDPVLKHGVFHDVSDEAGIKYNGYGHAATICDINHDGWKDIYVSDDFLSNNILYINNHDGTFSNRVKEYFKHTSFNSMGQDVVDINNDGLPDVIELDMNPPDNYRKKMMLATSSYLTYQNFESYGYQFQYVRNTLALNQGPRLEDNDTIGPPVFSDIAFMSGVAQTDWSWTPLVTDFDNDGYRDIVVTNGFPKDVSDHDFISYRKDATVFLPKSEIIKQIPEVKLHNYAFRNSGNLTFKDVSNDWGLQQPTFSNGAAWADFDNDGAPDMIISNINDKVLLYRNTSRTKDTANNHFIQVKLKGDRQNINGIGAMVTIYYDHGKLQTYENNPYRGYLSTVQEVAHFGLGKTSIVDSVVIEWPANKKQVIKNVKADRVITANIGDAAEGNSNVQPVVNTNAVFNNITKSLGITYKQKDFDVIDFNLQSVLPHKFSEYCPALASADVDANGLDDIIVGGTSLNPAQVFLQQTNGSFLQKDLYDKIFTDSYRDEGLLLFDANGDGHPDVYIASGGFQNESGSKFYQDRLFINDGKGHFELDSTALPVNHTSKLCVRGFDFNKDGKLDLFVSGRVDPWHYPKPVSSFIFRNDSKDGKAKFTDVTDQVAPALKNVGMVCDALFSDFDNDGQTDLILAGEWMPILLLKNNNGKFENVTPASGVSDKPGLWNSIVAGDFRHTGRTDYIVGNIGLNTFYQATDKYPLYITAGDFANNGSFIAIPSLFLPDVHDRLEEFPANGRDEIIERLPGLKKQFPDYQSFAKATMNDIIPPDKRTSAIRLKVNTLQSCYLRNDGSGKFTMIPLSKEAQFSVLNGMLADDFDGDGNLDVLISGNDYGTDVAIGRYDGLNGLLLKGNGNGEFTPLSILQSGIYIADNGKALIKLPGSAGNYLVAASEHSGPLRVFALKRKTKMVPINPTDISALIQFKNGKTQKEEFYYGSSFLSQSARFLTISDDVSLIRVTDSKGNTRNVTF
ncbi:MAG TPA: VCBS repeat-containing protein [Chitinophagaceae bacterium]|nr:VCBS repeat-containing protein [Chitinophagaceae bacterium]